jgi:acyl dehydratase
MTATAIAVGGPYFDELAVGDRIDSAPALTLTDGHAALHQAIVGDRLRLTLDRRLSREVVGVDAQLAHPALVCDVAIGQSTWITRRVVANLFYRGLVLRRAPAIGDTLATTTEVVALRENTRREGRAPTGLAGLRIHCVDQEGRDVLDFWRCAMLPLSPGAAPTGHADDLDLLPAELDDDALAATVAGWDLDRYRAATGAASLTGIAPGMRWDVVGGDVVGCAPELARLSLNVATAHHDGDGRRLVYGGHTIGIAAAQATRALPDLVTVVAWHGCDHVAPVYEGDTLYSEVELERTDGLGGGGALLHLRSRVRAVRADGGAAAEVLDWRFVGVAA